MSEIRRSRDGEAAAIGDFKIERKASEAKQCLQQANPNTISQSENRVTSLAFSHKSTVIAAGSPIGCIWIQRPNLPAITGQLPNYDPVVQIRFGPPTEKSSDSSNVVFATGATDIIGKITQTGYELGSSVSFNAMITSVAFSASGSEVAVGSSDGTIKIVDLRKPSTLQLVEAYFFRGVTGYDTLRDLDPLESLSTGSATAGCFSPQSVYGVKFLDQNRILVASNDTRLLADADCSLIAGPGKIPATTRLQQFATMPPVTLTVHDFRLMEKWNRKAICQNLRPDLFSPDERNMYRNVCHESN